MEDTTRQGVLKRLNYIEGHLAGIRRMIDDVRALAHPVLRHRILKNFHAESERITTDQLVDRLLEAVPVPASGM